MSGIKKKISRLQEIYKEEGLRATLTHIGRLIAVKAGWFYDHPVIGKLVEYRGNIVQIDGCHFSVDSPVITTALKSRFIMGLYEEKERRAVRLFLRSNLPVIELGASIGVVSCITNKKLENPRNHVVVEANPELIPLLIKNRDINNCSFTVLNKAYGPEKKEIIFFIHDRFINSSSQRASGKSISVPAISLADVFAEYKWPYASVICDIEGGEIMMTEFESNILRDKVLQIIVEIHPSDVGQEAINKFREDISSIGFEKIRTGSYSTVLVFENIKLKSLFAKHQ